MLFVMPVFIEGCAGQALENRPRGAQAGVLEAHITYLSFPSTGGCGCSGYNISVVFFGWCASFLSLNVKRRCLPRPLAAHRSVPNFSPKNKHENWSRLRQTAARRFLISIKRAAFYTKNSSFVFPVNISLTFLSLVFSVVGVL